MLADQSWPILQLIDSAFPAGAFAHSGGLEAAYQLGEIDSAAGLRAFAASFLSHAATASGPFVAAVSADISRLDAVDQFADAMLTNATANRASRVMGQSLILAAARVFVTPELRQLEQWVKDRRGIGHFAVAFGAVQQTMAADPRTAVGSYLFVTLRGLISAAVRLGIVGPIEGQAIQSDLSRESTRWVDSCLAVGDYQNAFGSSPTLDFYQSLQDRLYSRLFVS